MNGTRRVRRQPRIRGLVFVALIGASITTAEAEPARGSALAIYRLQPNSLVAYPAAAVSAGSGISMDQALARLVGRMNELLIGRKVVAHATVRPDGRHIIAADLVDEPNARKDQTLYVSFQGSLEAAGTTVFLVYSFLQPDYTGEWFDGVEFRINGKPMGEMDHANLSGVLLRRNGVRGYEPLPVHPGRTDGSLRAYLDRKLELAETARVTIIRVSGRDSSIYAAFFVSTGDRLAHRGVLRLTPENIEMIGYDPDPGYTTLVDASPITLVRATEPFILTEFSPLGGTCVGSNVTRILRIGSGGTFETVWSGNTFDGQGTRSEIATIRFTDLTGDGSREIIRSGKTIDCGDDCLCTRGPVTGTFEYRFAWSARTGHFELIQPD